MIDRRGSWRTTVPFWGAVVFVWLGIGAVLAQEEEEDILFSATPQHLTAVGDAVFFSAWDGGLTGRELWRSDGTPTGTFLVRDIRPTIHPDELRLTTVRSSKPDGLTDAGGTLFFAADEIDFGRELWKSDGTPRGTVRVKDIRPGLGWSSPEELTAVGGRLFFTADEGTHGRELWTSDGSTFGTRLVADLRSGPAGSDPRSLIAFLGELFFAADTPGPALWRSDGAGATRVSEGRVADPVVAGDRLYFVRDGALWESDGTPEGTRVVASTPGAPRLLTNADGTLFFLTFERSAAEEVSLWTSDGTAAGTVLVRKFSRVGWLDFFDRGRRLTAAVGDRFFFVVRDEQHRERLWRSDGTVAGTQLIDAAPNRETFPSFDSVTSAGGRLYFFADDAVHGQEPWVSDGTDEGTRLLRDLRPGRAGSFGRRVAPLDPDFRFVAAGDRVYFVAQGLVPDEYDADAVPLRGRTRVLDLELYRTDGTAVGTTLVDDVAPFGAIPSMIESALHERCAGCGG